LRKGGQNQIRWAGEVTKAKEEEGRGGEEIEAEEEERPIQQTHKPLWKCTWKGVHGLKKKESMGDGTRRRKGQEEIMYWAKLIFFG
jgi:hypothetical protein